MMARSYAKYMIADPELLTLDPGLVTQVSFHYYAIVFYIFF